MKELGKYIYLKFYMDACNRTMKHCYQRHIDDANGYYLWIFEMHTLNKIIVDTLVMTRQLVYPVSI